VKIYRRETAAACAEESYEIQFMFEIEAASRVASYIEQTINSARLMRIP
jgi:hypothetical protein